MFELKMGDGIALKTDREMRFNGLMYVAKAGTVGVVTKPPALSTALPGAFKATFKFAYQSGLTTRYRTAEVSLHRREVTPYCTQLEIELEVAA